MTGAPYTNPHLPPPVTGRSFRKIGLTLCALMLAVVGVVFALYKLQGKPVAAAVAEKAVAVRGPQSIYPPEEPKPSRSGCRACRGQGCPALGRTATHQSGSPGGPERPEKPQDAGGDCGPSEREARSARRPVAHYQQDRDAWPHVRRA